MAEKRYDVGTAYINLRARFEQATADAQEGGKAAGQVFGKTAASEAQKEFEKGFKPGGKAQSEKQGADSGDAFGKAYKGAVNAALKSLPSKISVEMDDDRVEAKIELIRAELEEISKTKIGADFDGDQAFARLLELKAELRSLGLETDLGQLSFDTGAASAAIGRFEGVLGGLLAELAGEHDLKITINDGSLVSKAKAAAKAAQAALGELYLDVNDEDVNAKVAEIKAKLEEIGNFRIGIDGDDRDFEAKYAEVRAKIAELRASNPSVRLSVDLAEADAKLDLFKAKLTKIGNTRTTAPVDADTSGSASGANNELTGLRSGVSGTIALLIGIGPALIPAMAAAGAAIAGLLAPLFAVTAAVGVLFLAFHGIIAAVQAMSQASAKNSATQQAQAQQAAAAQDAVKQAVQGVADAERALQDARTQAAQDASDDAKTVANALESEHRAAQDAAIAEVKAAEDVKNAERSVADARRTAARDAQDSAETIKNAQQGVADAITQNSQDIQAALDNQRQAQEALTKAEQDAKKAEKDLSEARIQSARDMQSLTNAIIDGRNALAGDKADVATLTVQYQQELLNPIGNAADRAAAQLALQEAQQKVVEQSQANTNNRQDLTHDQKQGGTDALLTAQQAQATAFQGVADAQTAVLRANQALTTAELGNNQRIEQAEQALSDARKSQARQYADDQRSIKDAERALSDARRAQAQQLISNQRSIEDAEKAVAQARLTQSRTASRDAEAIEKAQEGVANAVAAVGKAQAAAGLAAAKSATTVQTALDKLTPAGQAFAKFIFGLRGQFTDLSKAAQDGLLPGVEQGIKDLLPLMPSLVKLVGAISKALGDIFEKGAALAGKSGKGFLSFLTATSPGILKVYAQILGNFAQGLVDLLPVLQPFAKLLAGALLDLSNQFLKFAQGAGSNNTFKRLEVYMTQSFHVIGNLITQFLKSLTVLLPALAPIGAKIIGFLDGVFNYIQHVNPKTLQLIAEAFLALFATVTIGRGAIRAFESLTTVLKVLFGLVKIGGLFSAGLVSVGLALVYLYIHSAKFRGEVNPLIDDLKRFSSVIGAELIGHLKDLSAWLIKVGPGAFAKVIVFVQGLIKGFKNAIPIFKEIGDYFKDLGERIAKDVEPSLERFAALFDGGRGQKGLQALRFALLLAKLEFEAIFVAVKFLAPYIADVLAGAFSALIDVITTVVEIIEDVYDAFDDLLHLRFAAFGKDIAQLFLDIVNGLYQILNDLSHGSLDRMQQIGTKMIHSMVKGIESGAKYLGTHVKDFFTTMLHDIVSFFKISGNFSGVFSGYGNQLILGLLKGIGDKMDGLWTAVKNYFTTWLDKILGLFGIHSPSTVFATMGGQLIDGLINGIVGSAEDLWAHVKGFFQAMMTKIEGFFGIGSPKSLFATLGEDLIKGLVTGINNIAPSVKSALEGLATGLYDTLRTGINFVIDDILNGFINGYNEIVSLLKLPGKLKIPGTIPDVPAFPGFATGGIYPGYTPGKDIGIAAVSGGEAIMRPEWTKVVGPDYVAAANKAAVDGGEAGVARFMGGFSLGGIIGGVKDEFKKIKNIFDLPEKAAELILSPIKNEIENKIPDVGLMSDVLKGASSNLMSELIKSVVSLIGKANVGGSGWDYPLKGPVRINKPFGGADGHAGVDLYATSGTQVYAAHTGTIDKAEPGGLAGNYMLIKADGTPNWYDMEHLSSFQGHKAGDHVALGEKLALSGYTGNVHPAGPGGAHLHFGIAKTETIGSYGNIGNMLDPIAFLAAQGAGKAGSVPPPGSGSDPANPGSSAAAAQKYAQAQLPVWGWGPQEFGPLLSLWNEESKWNYKAYNASSGATGIPQALPGDKMADTSHHGGPDYLTNPATQMNWGFDYIKNTYKTPTRAWAFETSHSPNWYDQGGWLNNGNYGVNHSGKPEAVLTNDQSLAYARLAELAPAIVKGIENAHISVTGKIARTPLPIGKSNGLSYHQENTIYEVADPQLTGRAIARGTGVQLGLAGL